MVNLLENARCLGCGYLLQGLPKPECPECGRWFDPNNSATFSDARRRPTLAELWGRFVLRERFRPPTAVYLIALCLFAGVITIASISPAGVRTLAGRWPFPTTVPLIICVAMLIDTLRFAGAARFAKYLEDPESLADVFRGRRRRRMAYALAAFIMFTLLYPWPLAARMLVCYSELSNAVRDYESGKEALRFKQVGSFDVTFVVSNPRSPGTVLVAVRVLDWFESDLYGLTFDRHRRIGNWRRWLLPGWYVE